VFQPQPINHLLPSRRSRAGAFAAAADPTARIGAAVNAALLLRDVLRELPALAAALAPASSGLLRALRDTFGGAGFGALLQTLEAALEPEAQPGRTALASRLQQCFAVRAGAEGALEAARGALCRVTEQAQAAAAAARERCGADGGKVGCAPEIRSSSSSAV